MKGSAITGPVGKEAADLWPVSIHILKILELCVCLANGLDSVSLLTLAWSCKNQVQKFQK